VAALARHVCLRAPDKADNRAAAIKAASELVVELPQWEQEQFVGFVFSLSRTNKVGLAGVCGCGRRGWRGWRCDVLSPAAMPHLLCLTSLAV
jgi:hypothetical protein